MSITLLHPWVLILFILYPLIIYLASKFGTQRVFGNYTMLKGVVKKSISIERFLYPTILFLLLLSISYPISRSPSEVSIKSSRDIILLLDASNSMRDDNRFEVAKDILLDFVDRREGDRIGLVIFGDRAYTASPLTSDISTIKAVLKSLKAGVAGGRDTALYEAIYLATKLFKDRDREKSIILLTDGIDTIKDMPIDVPIHRLKDEDITLYGIGVGVDYRKDILERLSASKDRVFTAKSSKELREIYRSIDILNRDATIKKRVYNDKPLYRYTLILALTLMLILLFIIDDFRLLSLSILFTFLALIYPHSYREKSSKSSRAISIVLDISRDMRVRDIPPNRFKYAISRVKELIDTLDSSYDIALMAFDSRAYLISPPTRDREALKSKIEHLKVKLNRAGSSMVDTLIYSAKFLESYKDRKILLFTSSKLDREAIKRIERIKIPIYIYGVATLRGGIIEGDSGKPLEDSSGRVIVSYLDTNLADIASVTGGLFIPFSSGADGWSRLRESLIDDSSEVSLNLDEDSNSIIYLLITLSILFLLLSKIYPYIRRVE